MILEETQRELDRHHRLWLKKTRFRRFWWKIQRLFRWISKIPKYRLLLYMKQDNMINPAFSNGFVNSGARIGYDKQFFFLLDHDGKRFKNQVSCTIEDCVNKPTVAVIKLNVQSIERIEDNI